MMMMVLSIILMIAVAYAHMRGGLFTSLCMFVNVMLAGLMAFNFFEPIADWLERTLQGTFLAGYEDFFALIGLFAVTMAALRLITNRLAPEMLDFAANTQYIGAGVGLLTGYLLGGFLICAMETLPWHENFLEFRPRTTNDSGLRSVLPPDRVWLSTMRYAGATCLAWQDDMVDSEPPADSDPRYYQYSTFDRYGTFELRYQRYRRFGDNRNPSTYQRELEKEIYRGR